MKKKTALTLLLTALTVLSASAQTGYYLQSTGTNNPPLPFNPKPGYPVETIDGKQIVNDTLTDQQTLTRGLFMMETDVPEPPPFDQQEAEGTGDTNAFLGMYVIGLYCPGGVHHSFNQCPDAWTISCTNANGSPYPHAAGRWDTMQRVCAGDTVAVRWHDECTNHTLPWPCLILLEFGTNSGGYYTNIGFGYKQTSGVASKWVVPASLHYDSQYNGNTSCWATLTAPPPPFSWETNGPVPPPLQTNLDLHVGACLLPFKPVPDTSVPIEDGPATDPWPNRPHLDDPIDVNNPHSFAPVGGYPPYWTLYQWELWLYGIPLKDVGGLPGPFPYSLHFSGSVVHAPPGRYSVEAKVNGGTWTTNNDAFTGSSYDMYTNSSTGGYTWTNRTSASPLIVDTNGLTVFFYPRNTTNSSQFYRVRKL